LTDTISIKLKYPEFSVLESVAKTNNVTDMAFDMIAESVEYIFDGEQYYYAAESEPDEIIEFIESLNQDQFNKIENFFNNLPKLNKNIEVDCKKCGFHHSIQVEGLDSFFA
jgi:predicted nucleic-acid-binding Zn-ribbon protein